MTLKNLVPGIHTNDESRARVDGVSAKCRLSFHCLRVKAISLQKLPSKHCGGHCCSSSLTLRRNSFFPLLCKFVVIMRLKTNKQQRVLRTNKLLSPHVPATLCERPSVSAMPPIIGAKNVSAISLRQTKRTMSSMTCKGK